MIIIINYYHKACSVNKVSMTSQIYEKWYARHEENCCINYTGTSGGMEVNDNSFLYIYKLYNLL